MQNCILPFFHDSSILQFSAQSGDHLPDGHGQVIAFYVYHLDWMDDGLFGGAFLCLI